MSTESYNQYLNNGYTDLTGHNVKYKDVEYFQNEIIAISTGIVDYDTLHGGRPWRGLTDFLNDLREVTILFDIYAVENIQHLPSDNIPLLRQVSSYYSDILFEFSLEDDGYEVISPSGTHLEHDGTHWVASTVVPSFSNIGFVIRQNENNNFGLDALRTDFRISLGTIYETYNNSEISSANLENHRYIVLMKYIPGNHFEKNRMSEYTPNTDPTYTKFEYGYVGVNPPSNLFNGWYIHNHNFDVIRDRYSVDRENVPDMGRHTFIKSSSAHDTIEPWRIIRFGVEQDVVIESYFDTRLMTNNGPLPRLDIYKDFTSSPTVGKLLIETHEATGTGGRIDINNRNNTIAAPAAQYHDSFEEYYRTNIPGELVKSRDALTTQVNIKGADLSIVKNVTVWQNGNRGPEDSNYALYMFDMDTILDEFHKLVGKKEIIDYTFKLDYQGFSKDQNAPLSHLTLGNHSNVYAIDDGNCADTLRYNSHFILAKTTIDGGKTIIDIQEDAVRQGSVMNEFLLEDIQPDQAMGFIVSFNDVETFGTLSPLFETSEQINFNVFVRYER